MDNKQVVAAFEETFGKIGDVYSEDDWLARFGVFICGWQACIGATEQVNAAELLPSGTNKGTVPPPPEANVTEYNKAIIG